jgi:uncharacterized membrane-anchored protein
MLLAANYTIYRREALLSGGRIVLLELAPVDPRSLMQGDYMALRFKVADVILDRARAGGPVRDGFLVLTLDERNVGTFARQDDGTPLDSSEIRIRYRVRGDTVRFATDAFFFQEGTAQRYEGARYGEFRLDATGDSILTGLRGQNLDPLGES